MFKKIVAIEPVNLTADAEKELRLYAEEVCMYHDIPGDDQETVSYTHLDVYKRQAPGQTWPVCFFSFAARFHRAGFSYKHSVPF